MVIPKLPFVSICLLTYKRAQALPRSLDSLLAQTHRDFELIINDDNSPDETEKVCREYERRDSRVRYCRNEHNLRYAGNQNAALARARAEFVAIVHDGDEYRPDLIEAWVRALVDNPTAALVFNAMEGMDEEGRVQRVYRHPYPPLVPGRKLLEDMLQRPDSPIFGIVMVRKKCVETVGPFDTRLPTLADIDMWMRLLALYDAAYIAEPLLRVAAREKNHHNNAGNWKVFAESEQIYRMNFARAYPTPESAPRGARQRMEQMLRRQRWFRLAWCLKKLKFGKFAEGMRSWSLSTNRASPAVSPVDIQDHVRDPADPSSLSKTG